jgi:hypothetical protein
MLDVAGQILLPQALFLSRNVGSLNSREQLDAVLDQLRESCSPRLCAGANSGATACGGMYRRGGGGRSNRVVRGVAVAVRCGGDWSLRQRIIWRRMSVRRL